MSRVNGCPDDEQVFAVLDRAAGDSDAHELRAHVSGCARCLARFGPLFELELWAEALARTDVAASPDVTRATRPAPAAPLRSLERIAVAATLIVLAGLVARVASPGSSAPPGRAELRVLSLSLVESTVGPDGSIELRRTLEPGPPALVRLQELRKNRDGAAVVHERFLPLDAAARE